jgi:hypothetical protein
MAMAWKLRAWAIVVGVGCLCISSTFEESTSMLIEETANPKEINFFV